MPSSRKTNRRRNRVPDVFPRFSFRPGYVLAREIPAVAGDLHLSVGALIRRALSDLFYSMALSSLFVVHSEVHSHGGQHGKATKR